ncbi:MAG: hypothetical protein H9Q66_03825, partial [Spiroplasma ixodetis]|nr:hypothetical protein [Spiroplasma ixodetis]
MLQQKKDVRDEVPEGGRIWKPQKGAEAPVVKLTDGVDFADWLTHFRVAANAADIEDCFFETEPENMPYVKADD